METPNIPNKIKRPHRQRVNWLNSLIWLNRLIRLNWLNIVNRQSMLKRLHRMNRLNRLNRLIRLNVLHKPNILKRLYRFIIFQHSPQKSSKICLKGNWDVIAPKNLYSWPRWHMIDNANSNIFFDNFNLIFDIRSYIRAGEG